MWIRYLVIQPCLRLNPQKTPKPKLHWSLKLEDNLKVIFVIITVETKNKDLKTPVTHLLNLCPEDLEQTCTYSNQITKIQPFCQMNCATACFKDQFWWVTDKSGKSGKIKILFQTVSSLFWNLTQFLRGLTPSGAAAAKAKKTVLLLSETKDLNYPHEYTFC